MTISNINRSGKIQVCIHNRYGRIERAPGKSEFHRITPSETRKRQARGAEYVWVRQETIPDDLIRRHNHKRGRKKRDQRCSQCLTVYPVSEFVGALCRGCFCGCGTLDDELRGLRRDFANRDAGLRRDTAIMDCVFETGE